MIDLGYRDPDDTYRCALCEHTWTHLAGLLNHLDVDHGHDGPLLIAGNETDLPDPLLPQRRPT